jgi:hypothetical protein
MNHTFYKKAYQHNRFVWIYKVNDENISVCELFICCLAVKLYSVLENSIIDRKNVSYTVVINDLNLWKINDIVGHFLCQ